MVLFGAKTYCLESNSVLLVENQVVFYFFVLNQSRVALQKEKVSWRSKKLKEVDFFYFCTLITWMRSLKVSYIVGKKEK